ncbi:MAG: YeeE/YedE family protein [Kordiimonadaceae bacterium]|jgi:uncharacterized protein|nr:YeeE/YedE family protein [Kordiimonadaceae bacterium]MBT6033008.1 YeeE/YedE family protein [Kordiimonadaceae bacterium]
MTDFTPVASLIGGLLIGFSALMVMFFHGRIAGISGILSRLLPPWYGMGGVLWRVAFLIGIVVSPFIYQMVTGSAVSQSVSNDKVTMILAGLCVGFGTGIGSGCTSGHGVCGISRLSLRSIVATITFMAFGIITVYIIRHIIGGSA